MNAREVARRVLKRVDEGAYATLALAGELERARLSDADRGLATELVYGVLKRRARLDWALSRLAPRGLESLDARVLDALRLGAYQILFLRVPAHAAVDDAVEAIKRARSPKLAGFANAVLRRLAREGEPAAPDAARDPVAHLEVVCSAPRWLVDDALARFGPDEARALLDALNAPAPLWVRTNTLRTTPDALAERLANERAGLTVTRSPLVPEALRLDGAGDPGKLAAFADGWLTPQDVAAQLVARLCDPQPDERILDACAGVGGKSTHLAALAGDRARIDSADLSVRKLELAADTARRLGVTSLRTVACDLADAGAPLEAAYDRVLLDAPCSGLGVLRRHPEAKWRRGGDERRALAALQARILEALAPRVRPGGVLVYSVCTFTDEEGPMQLRRLLDGIGGARFTVEKPAEPALQPLLDGDGAVRTWPHRHDADAFYAVRVRRMG